MTEEKNGLRSLFKTKNMLKMPISKSLNCRTIELKYSTQVETTPSDPRKSDGIPIVGNR
jgi:hypothetical protein